MVHGNAVYIREAKQARNAHWYTFSTQNFTSFKVNFTAGCNYCSRGYDVTLGGGVTHKSGYLRGAKSFAFSQQLARN